MHRTAGWWWCLALALGLAGSARADLVAPGDVAVIGSTWRSVTLSWTDLSSEETGYLIEYRPEGGSEFFVITITAANATSGTATFLNPDVEDYELRVRPEAGSSYWTPTPASAPLDFTLPEFPAPIDVEAEAVDWDELYVTWVDPSGGGAYLYMIEYRALGTTTWLETWGNMAMYGCEAHPGQFGAGPFTADTTYELRIRPYLGYMSQPQAASEPVQVTTPPYPSPTDVEATAVDWDEVFITWENPADDVYVFMIEYREQGTTTWLESWGSMPMYGNQATLGSYRLEAATTYEVRVVPWLNMFTPMPPSEVVTVTTPAYPSPTDVQATAVASDEVFVTWENPADDVYVFMIEYRVQGTTTWLEASGSMPMYGNQATLGPGRIVAATTYELRVVPWLNMSTPMPPSAIVTVTTP